MVSRRDAGSYHTTCFSTGIRKKVNPGPRKAARKRTESSGRRTHHNSERPPNDSKKECARYSAVSFLIEASLTPRSCRAGTHVPKSHLVSELDRYLFIYVVPKLSQLPFLDPGRGGRAGGAVGRRVRLRGVCGMRGCLFVESVGQRAMCVCPPCVCVCFITSKASSKEFCIKRKRRAKE